MKVAKVAELKNRLSHYLRMVRRGESIVVYDRDKPVARIEPVRDPSAIGDAAWTADLVVRGILRAPNSVLPNDWLAGRATGRGNVVGALLDERAQGR